MQTKAKKTVWLVCFLLVFPLAQTIFAGPQNKQAKVNIVPRSIKQKVDKLLKQMTLEEKIGQMTQVTLSVIVKNGVKGNETDELEIIDADRLKKALQTYHVGSILNVVNDTQSLKKWHYIINTIQGAAAKTRLKIPVLYGVDSIHGANYVKEATIFPQSIGMAATFNRKLVEQEGNITALETRASGVPWNFNPVLGVGRQPLWPRLWETYGEDSFLTTEMGAIYVKAQEGRDNASIIQNNKVATSIKHYPGYTFPLSGKDRTPAWIPERMFREYFLPPFAKGVQMGAHTVMINSTEINGIPVHASPYYLKTILRDELGFQGLAVSDWSDIKNLHTRSRVASSHREAVKIAVMAGVDMSMVPTDFSFYNHLLALVKAGEVPVSRIDEAVKRILLVKFKLQLFKNPFPDKTLKNQVGSKKFQQVALNAARESITLLKNKNKLLPLAKGKKILVVGPTANRLSVLNGGWSTTWQGNKESAYPAEKDTILEAIRKKFGAANVSFIQGHTFNPMFIPPVEPVAGPTDSPLPGTQVETDADTSQAGQFLKVPEDVDVIVACMGEPAYCEAKGNINDLTLSKPQIKLLNQLADSGKPIILVLTEGRPRLIRPIINSVDAVIMAYLPGYEGGRAIAEILAGDVNPSGRLPITYPKYPNALMCYDHKYSEDSNENSYDPEFPFGFGMSYTRFKYSGLAFNKTVMQPGGKLIVSVKVKNIGKRSGKEAVLLYISDLYAHITPSVRRLKGFEKISLEPGEEKEVIFSLSDKDLSFIGRDMKPVVEPGEFKISVGSLSKNFKRN